MTEPSAKVILDSVNTLRHRLTTMEVVMHRFVLAEFNTHRRFSRNSASSRAIPAEKQLARFVEDWAFPLSLPAEQPGMQGGSELEGEDRQDAVDFLTDLHDYTAQRTALYFEKHPDKARRLHKSVASRPMEWGQYHTVIVSSTEWQNFFDQRVSPLAQPEIHATAAAMQAAYEASTPTFLDYDEWHTPYILPEEYTSLDLDVRKRASAARCALVSYWAPDDVDFKPNVQKDLARYERLVTAVPAHASPLEHVATPLRPFADGLGFGNFRGWHQLRHSVLP